MSNTVKINDKKVLIHELNLKSAISFFCRKIYYYQAFKLLAQNYAAFQTFSFQIFCILIKVLFLREILGILYQILGFVMNIVVISKISDCQVPYVLVSTIADTRKKNA